MFRILLRTGAPAVAVMTAAAPWLAHPAQAAQATQSARRAHVTPAVARVPCDPAALASDISGAASGATLSLASGCVYVLTAALPTVSRTLTISGNGATLERSAAHGTPAFTILSVTAGTLSLTRLSFTNGRGGISVTGSA